MFDFYRLEQLDPIRHYARGRNSIRGSFTHEDIHPNFLVILQPKIGRRTTKYNVWNVRECAWKIYYRRQWPEILWHVSTGWSMRVWLVLYFTKTWTIFHLWTPSVCIIFETRFCVWKVERMDVWIRCRGKIEEQQKN